jgi:transcription elongation GreA/GreB family factor
MAQRGELKEELVALLRAELATAEKAYRATTEAATHEESKPENDKDTRALEQSYLARGQALRVEELRGAVAEVSSMNVERRFGSGRAVLGALVTVADDAGQKTTYWLVAHGGGSRLAIATVQVVTPQSPLGRALIGKMAGDEGEVVIAGRARLVEIVAVD